MKYEELKEKSLSELESLLKTSREKLRDLRFKVASKQLKNVREVRSEKKAIARILTLINQKSRNNKKSSSVTEKKENK